MKILRKIFGTRNPRWGVTYSVYDGLEILEASIRSIRPHVDYVNVVYSDISWYGVPAGPELLPLLKKLKKAGLIDELIKFDFEPTEHSGGHLETQKRQMGLDAAKGACDYLLLSDADELY
ncbi:MAG: hypothetical protein FWG39_03590, partial [Alphaproteobacteria bacterium]|nr:hypothetical protein [Alphaproteobacteria bacterium]